jgi:hypothetical protein
MVAEWSFSITSMANSSPLLTAIISEARQPRYGDRLNHEYQIVPGAYYGVLLYVLPCGPLLRRYTRDTEEQKIGLQDHSRAVSHGWCLKSQDVQ